MTEHNETVKHVLDVAAIFTTVGTFLEVISPVFGFIGAVVGVMRIAEMITGKPFSEIIGWKKEDKNALDK